MRQIKLRNLAALPIALVGLIIPVPAGAVEAGDDAEVTVEFGDELIFGSQGSTASVRLVDVDPTIVGRECHLTIAAENQSSVHPGNDLIITTGASELVVTGIEDEADGRTDQEFDVVLGSVIDVQLRFGPDKMSSLGFTLDFDCSALQPIVEPTRLPICPLPDQEPATDTTTPLQPPDCIPLCPAPDQEPATDGTTPLQPPDCIPLCPAPDQEPATDGTTPLQPPDCIPPCPAPELLDVTEAPTPCVTVPGEPSTSEPVVAPGTELPAPAPDAAVPPPAVEVAEPTPAPSPVVETPAPAVPEVKGIQEERDSSISNSPAIPRTPVAQPLQQKPDYTG